MPPRYAGLINADLQLSDTERAELVSGLRAMPGGSRQASTASMPADGSAVLVATLGTVLAALGFALGRARLTITPPSPSRTPPFSPRRMLP